ncbi:hypothetical protein C4D60_Mb00t14420 [Musa balbisiana]|uniref:Uncharacterized protein n=1 Tax=Musa balbisiana TaxID=52838 RepID=A0A4S8I699_MUSBA|nr:hypothetical protein C4D60_Mb00t14420 [Musa balbisiana]
MMLVATAVFLIDPIDSIGQGCFSDGMPLGIQMVCLTEYLAEHNILMHLLNMLGVALVYSALVLCMVPWSTLVESGKPRKTNPPAHGSFRRLICQYASFHNSRSFFTLILGCLAMESQDHEWNARKWFCLSVLVLVLSVLHLKDRSSVGSGQNIRLKAPELR